MLAVGVGLTDSCQLQCPFCYSRPHGDRFLDPSAFFAFLDEFPVESVNFGTGESILHPDFCAVVERTAPGRRLSVTSNGLTVHRLEDRQLRLFHDIDFSLDFPDRDRQDAWRRGACYDMVIEGLDRCARLGIPASVVAVVMGENVMELGALLEVARAHDATLRLNLYKKANGLDLAPGYDRFWEGLRLLLADAVLVSCTEPVLAAHPAVRVPPPGVLCGVTSFRIKPDGGISACPYDRKASLTLEEVLRVPQALWSWLQRNREAKPFLPAPCRDCTVRGACQGGCRSRREHNGGIEHPDSYCFMGDRPLPPLAVTAKPSRFHVHAGYLCTTIVA